MYVDAGIVHKRPRGLFGVILFGGLISVLEVFPKQQRGVIAQVLCSDRRCQLFRETATAFFFARVGALCVPRAPRRIRMGSTGSEPDEHDQQNQTKPQNQTPPQQKQPTTQNQKGQAQVRTSLKEQKVRIRGPTQ